MDPAVIGGSSEWPMKGRTLPIKNAFEFVLIMVPLSKTKKIAHSNNLFLPLVIAGLTNPDPLTRTLFWTLPPNAHLFMTAIMVACFVFPAVLGVRKKQLWHC